MSFGKLMIAALLDEGSVDRMLKLGPVDHLFKGAEPPVWEFVKGFVSTHGQLPKADTVTAHTGDKLPVPKEPVSYYVEQMRIRHKELVLKDAIKNAGASLQPDNLDVDKALGVMAETVMSLVRSEFSNQIADFRDAYDLIVPEYVAKAQGTISGGLRLGWPTLDDMTNGLGVGDLLSMVGRPGAGKTLQLLFAALHGWSTPAVEGVQDQSRLFVSMEMPILQIEQRMAAIHTHLPGGKLKQGKLASKSFTKLKKGLKELKGFPHPFWIVDGNLAATVEDVTLLARQLNPAAIFIDGGYLLKHPSERDRYKRVAENADLIKSMLCPIAPTVVSWQFSRSGGKKHLKKGEKPTMDDIGYTDAIAQVSSLILGITQAENVETLKARQIDVLKGRFGETGSFLTNWNWETMDFSEIVEKNVEDMHYD